METQTIIQTAESSLLHTYNRFPIVLDHGEDVYLYDTDQKKYLDFAAGIAVFALGYSNDAYKTAVKEQVDSLYIPLICFTMSQQPRQQKKSHS